MMSELAVKFVVQNHRLNKYSIAEFAREVLKLSLWPEQEKALVSFYESGKIEFLMVCGKKSGKSFMAAVISLYEIYKLLLIENPQQHYGLLENSPIYSLNTCVSKGQAENILLEYVKSMVKGSEFMSMYLVDNAFTASEVEFKKNLRILAQSSNSVSSLGYTCIITLFDELAWFRDTTGNFSGKAVYDALKPNIKPIGKDGKSIILSSPGDKKGVFYKIYTDTSKYDTTFLLHAPTWVMNPSISREDLNDDFDKDPQKSAMDWGAEFIDTLGVALNTQKIDEAVQHDNLDVSRTTGKDFDYIIALDPALRSDRFALALGHMEDDETIIDYVRTWGGTPTNPVIIEEVEDFVRMICKNFRVVLIVLDQHQSASTIQRFTKEGFNIKETTFTAKYNVQIFSSLNERLNMGKIKLPNDLDLIAELKSLQRKGAGQFAKYEAPTSGAMTFDDLCDVTANVNWQLQVLNEIDIGTDSFACDEMLEIDEDEEEEINEANRLEKKGEVEDNEFAIY